MVEIKLAHNKVHKSCLFLSLLSIEQKVKNNKWVTLKNLLLLILIFRFFILSDLKGWSFNLLIIVY